MQQQQPVQPTTSRSLYSTTTIDQKYQSTYLQSSSSSSIIKNNFVSTQTIKYGLILVVVLIVVLGGIFIGRALRGGGSLRGRVEIVGDFSEELAERLIGFYRKEGAKTVLDLECGRCYYGRNIETAGIKVQAYDANPYSQQLTDGFVKFVDSTITQNIPPHDWVQSLQIQDHISQTELKTFLENIAKAAKIGLIVSWSPEKKGKLPEDSIQMNKIIIEFLKPFGFVQDQMASMEFRNIPNLQGLKNSLLVFRAQF